jgi:hypothetical protein
MMNRKLIVWPLATIMVLTILAIAAVPASASGPTKTALTVFAPVTVHSTQTFDITGKLLTTGNIGLSDMPVSVYKSTDGETWDLVGTDMTGSDGYYTVQDLIPNPGQCVYRAIFAGDKLYKGAKTGKTTVTAEPGPTTTAAYGVLTVLYYEGEEFAWEFPVTATYDTGAGPESKTTTTDTMGKFVFDALPVGVPIDFVGIYNDPNNVPGSPAPHQHTISWTATLQYVEGGYNLGNHRIIAIHPPIASFTFLVNDLTVNFQGGGSAMVDTLYWDFGDGSTRTSLGGVSIIHTYAVPDTYDVTLTATNIAGSSTITKQVTV